MTSQNFNLLMIFLFSCAFVVSLVGLVFAIRMLREHNQSSPPARTYDQDLMDRQIAKLRRVASQTDAPSEPQNIVYFGGQSSTLGEPNGDRRFWPTKGAPNSCTGKCKQGRNCTCMPAARGAKP